MGISNTKEAGNLSQIQAVLAAIKGALLVVCAFVEALQEAISELERVRGSLAQNKRPLNWEAFVEAMRHEANSKALADKLKAVEVRKFEFGKLCIVTNDSILQNYLCLMKENITAVLHKNYGGDFKVKIL